MKNKNIKIISVIIGIFILIISIFYRNNYIVKNNKQIIKEMDESTQVSSLNSTINELNKTHEEYQTYIQNCKTQIATALTNEGVTTSSEEKLETMASNISKVLQAKTSDATATADNITEGKIAYVNGKLITGTGVDNNSSYNKGYIEGKNENDLKTTLYHNYANVDTTYEYTFTGNYDEVTIIASSISKWGALAVISYSDAEYEEIYTDVTTDNYSRITIYKLKNVEVGNKVNVYCSLNGCIRIIEN